MYSTKGRMKVFNGERYKTVNYLRNGIEVIFATSSKSRKYREIKKSENTIRVLLDGEEIEYKVEVVEDEKKVDELFRYMKLKRAILFFIPRRDKIIVRYSL